MALPVGLKTGMSTKEQIDGEQWGAACLMHAIIYRRNGTVVKTAEVPEYIKEALIASMEAGADEITPSPEDIAQVAKSLEVPHPEYQPSKFEDELGFEMAAEPAIDYEAEFKELQARSVDNVNLKVLTQALFERFGIYTCYLNRAPQSSDISPLTGETMSVFICGQANQSFKSAQRTGASWNPKVIKFQIELSRTYRGATPTLPKSDLAKLQTVGSPYGRESDMPSLYDDGYPRERVNRHFESPHRSALHSERGRDSDGTDPDEIYAEPPINAANPIIRAFFPNERSMEQLRRISQRIEVTDQEQVSFEDLI